MRPQPRDATIDDFSSVGSLGVRAPEVVGHAKWLEMPTYWSDVSTRHRYEGRLNEGGALLGARVYPQLR